MDENQKQKQALIGKAFFYLRFHARSEQEMRKYLQKKAELYGFDNTIVQIVIQQLIEDKYINDNEFARSFMQSRSHTNPKGDYAITQELLQKGISKEIIISVLQENDTNEYARAVSVLKKKQNTLSKLTNEVRLRRALSHLIRRGFSYNIAKQAYKHCFENESE